MSLTSGKTLIREDRDEKFMVSDDPERSRGGGVEPNPSLSATMGFQRQ
jgi:hypothetical protein